MAKPTRAALLDFLDYLSSKGLMNKTTVSARKAAANKVLGIIDDSEAEDLSKIDLDDVMTRFHHLEGAKYTPESLSAYKSRVKSAIEDLLRYQRDPLTFRPALQSPARKAEKGRAPRELPAARQAEPPAASVGILPIPIRSDLVVKIQGLPFDLTASEAAKIANVVRAMAIAD